MIFWSFVGTITYPKDNICFQKLIIQWQIKLISYRSEFWHLSRKSAVIFSKWLFWQNYLMISWTTWWEYAGRKIKLFLNVSPWISWIFFSHYVDWDFNSKITSHFQFLQKPFILDVCKPLKKKLKIFYVGPRRYSHLSVLDRMDRPG